MSFVLDRNDREFHLFIQSIHFLNIKVNMLCLTKQFKGCRGRDRMVVGFITTYAISAYHH